MRPKSTLRHSLLLAATALLAALAPASAQTPVAITNAGFENPVLPTDGQLSSGAIPGWSAFNSGALAVLNPSSDNDLTAEAPAGQNVGLITSSSNEDGMSQTLAAQFQADTIYALTVKVANTKITGGFPGYRVQLAAGGTILAEEDNSQTVAEDSVVTSILNYTYNAGLHAGVVGQPLEIRLLSKGLVSGQEIAFDDVQLTLTLSLPNPVASSGGPYTVLSATSLVLDGSGSLPSEGATITAYDWDLNNDGTFGDVTGATPAAISYADLAGTWGMGLGANTIKLRVTDSAAKTAVATTTVTRQVNANLANLMPSAGTLTPAFASGTASYTASAPGATTDITVTPTAEDPAATITVNGDTVASGSPSDPIPLAVGDNVISVVVTATDTITTKSYTLTVTRGPRTLYSSGTKPWDTTTGNWGTVSGGPYNTATWSNSDGDSAVFEGTAGTVTLGEAISLKNLTINTVGYTITGSTLNFTSGTITTPNPPNTNAPGATIESNITGAPAVNANALATNEWFTFKSAASGSMVLGAITGASGNSAGQIAFQGGEESNSVVAGVIGPKSHFTGSGTWTLTGLARGYENRISSGTLIISTGTLQNDNRGTTLSGTTTTLHYNNPAAIRDNRGSFTPNENFEINGGFIDQTSGAAITTSTWNPDMTWGGNWTFIGSNGADSNLFLGNGRVLLTATRQVTVQHADTTLVVGGVIQHSSGSHGLTKAGDGTLELRGASTYTGATKVNAGTLKLGTAGSLANGTSVSIAAGATFDLTENTAASATYTWNTTSLSASGAATPATISGTALGTIDMGIKPISLTTDGTNPSLTVTGAALTLGGNSFTVVVPGPALTAGVYTLVSADSITGTVNPTASYTGGNGLAVGATGVASISGNTVILTVTGGGGTPYEIWAGPGVNFDDDANGDGVDNGLAWVLGALDKDANAIALLPTLDNTSDPDFFIFTYRRDDDANTDPKTTIKVEYGSTLAAWTTAVAGADIIITPTDDGAGAGIDLVQVKIRRTLAVGGKLFARLNVANTP